MREVVEEELVTVLAVEQLAGRIALEPGTVFELVLVDGPELNQLKGLLLRLFHIIKVILFSHHPLNYVSH